MEALNTKKYPLWSIKSIRCRVIILLAAALCIEGLMRTNLNMAMVCMVNRTAIIRLENPIGEKRTMKISEKINSQNFEMKQNDNNKLPSANANTAARLTSNPCDKLQIRKSSNYRGELIWTSKEQARIFAAFYVGGLFVVIPGSYLCDWFGASNVVQAGAIINIFGSISTPFISRHIGVYGIIIIRFCMGCGQGVLVPCMSVLIAHWFPNWEKSTAVAIATTGNQLSLIFAMFITAELCQIKMLGGWPSAFYLYGLFGVGLCIVWFIFVADVPTTVLNITDEELLHITGTTQARGQKRRAPENVPWRKILSSMAVWSTAMCSFCQYFVTVGTVTYLPLYYRTVLNMDLTSNGLLSALPFAAQLVAKLIFASVADRAKRDGYAPTAVTKLCNLFASIGGALCFTALIFFDCTYRWTAVLFICLAMGILSGYIPGYNTSIVCLAPKYTASVASFCRLWATIGSVVAPYLIGMITIKSVLAEWRFVFAIMTVLLIITGLLFQLYGAAHVQKWAVDEEKCSGIVSVPLAIQVENEDYKNSGSKFLPNSK